jgi:hypothetical protein
LSFKNDDFLVQSDAKLLLFFVFNGAIFTRFSEICGVSKMQKSVQSGTKTLLIFCRIFP